MSENQSEYKCHSCGNILSINEEVCPLCRSKQNRNNDIISPASDDDTHSSNQNTQNLDVNNIKSRYAAAILALLFGNFGAHRFYFRRYVSAVLYILFSWTPIIGILSNIEAILIVKFGQENLYKHIIRNEALKVDEATNTIGNITIIVFAILNIIRVVIFSIFTTLPILSFYDQDIPWKIYDIFRWLKEFFEYHIY